MRCIIETRMLSRRGFADLVNVAWQYSDLLARGGTKRRARKGVDVIMGWRKAKALHGACLLQRLRRRRGTLFPCPSRAAVTVRVANTCRGSKAKRFRGRA